MSFANLIQVLVVDDSEVDRRLTSQILQKAKLNVQVTEKENAAAALDFLLGRGIYADRKTYPLPDIVFLDITMEDTDGFSVLERMRREPFLDRLPVIMLTSSEREEDLIKSYDQGATRFLRKPVIYEDVIAAVAPTFLYMSKLNDPRETDEGN